MCEVIFGFCREFYGLILFVFGNFLGRGPLFPGISTGNPQTMGPGTKGQIVEEKGQVTFQSEEFYSFLPI